MRHRLLLGFCLLFAFAASAQRELSFNINWRFVKDSTIDASVSAYDDSKWRTLSLPHDWSIEDLPNQKVDSVSGPFDRKSIGGRDTGFTLGGTGWYRKRFITEKSFVDRVVTIHFDGVYMNSDVWLNGHLLGNHPYGYTPFHYDLTPYLNPEGKDNTMVVRVRNQGKNSRWYSGSGIYRDVWLTVTNKVHIEPFGVQVIIKEVNPSKALVEIQTKATDTVNVSIEHTLLSPEKKIIKRTSGTSFEIESPVLWSIENPRLYSIITEIKQGKKTLDRVETTFGIRSISVSAETGLLLNGKQIELKGGCIHHDNGPLGTAVYYRAEERKIQLLKDNGFNAVRISHNPPSRQLLDACDRLGMLVIDEAFDMWEKPKNPQDYHLYFKEWWKRDLDAMVLRDRNHPSIIFWSIGNEIKERVDSSGLRITKALADRVHELDPSRPVTEALCFFWDNPGYQWKQTAAAYALLDIGGYNYTYTQYESDHKEFPSRVMLGTESFPTKALENWNLVEKHPYVIGDFVWTAFDYIGEASIGNSKYGETRKLNMALGFPYYNAFCGDLDLIGNKKPQSYYRDIVWNNKAITMAVHAPVPDGMVESVSPWGWPDEAQSWTWPTATGKTMQVRVFSRAQSVRLVLNGKVVAEKQVPANSITTLFDVPYEPGTLKAINVTDGKEGESIELKTAGDPVNVRLKADRSTISKDSDLSYVTVELLDNRGQVATEIDAQVDFTVTGEGSIIGVANGSSNDVSSFQAPTKKTWKGQCVVVIRSNGKSGNIVLNARIKSLPAAQVSIVSK